MVALVYLGLVIGLNGLKGGWSIDFWREMILFGSGVIIGVWLLFLDRLVYVYIYPQEQLSQHVWYLWRQKRYGQALAILDARRSEQNRLMLRSALFMIIWVVLALFSLTSTLSWFGKGVVMGLMWHVLYDSWRLQRANPNKLTERLFWQIKKKVSTEEQLGFLTMVTVIFGLFSWWV